MFCLHKSVLFHSLNQTPHLLNKLKPALRLLNKLTLLPLNIPELLPLENMPSLPHKPGLPLYLLSLPLQVLLESPEP